MRQRLPTEMGEISKDLNALACLLGEARALALAEEARPLLWRHRTADEGAA